MTAHSDSFDRHMMDIAIRLASQRLGTAAPNPAVGAVIADETTGEVIARAATAPGGRPHAETQAIERAGPRARGATIYVTLEPCAHHGRTGPCAEAIVAAGLARCVTAIEDPDPRVAGRGLDRLRSAGIEVSRGVRAAEARWLTRGHIVRVTERRPFITLKLALDQHGAVPRGEAGKPRWVTGPLARAHGHLLRATHDAILIGSGTARDDNPALTCRLPGLDQRTPIRCVLDGDLSLNPDSQLARTARQWPVLVFTTRRAYNTESLRQPLEARGVIVIAAGDVGGRIWLPSVMDALVTRGITRLLVEGGPALWRSFAQQSLCDAVALYMAGGADTACDTAREAGARDALGRHLGSDLRLGLEETSKFGPDRLWVFHKLPATEGS